MKATRVALATLAILNCTRPVQVAAAPAEGSDCAFAIRDQSVAHFDQAVREYEICLKRSSKAGAEGILALGEGVTLALGLGEPERAIALLETYGPRFAEMAPWLTTRLDTLVVEWHAERHHWQALLTFLSSKRLARIDAATLEVRVRVHAALGRARAGRGEPKSAQAEYEKVVSLFKDPNRVLSEIEAVELAAVSRRVPAHGGLFADSKLACGSANQRAVRSRQSRRSRHG